MNTSIKKIFRCMMEDGYYPTFEKTHILFNIDDNMAVLEYDEDILSVRIFFTIDEDAYDLFLEASNAIMTETYAVKPAILDDMKNIMFSFEAICTNVREIRKILPRGIELLKKAIEEHKDEMRRLILAENVSSVAFAANEDTFNITKGAKLLS